MLPEGRLAYLWLDRTERLRDLLVGADGAKRIGRDWLPDRGQWLHVLSTPWLTLYRTSERRGSLLEGLRGLLGA